MSISLDRSSSAFETPCMSSGEPWGPCNTTANSRPLPRLVSWDCISSLLSDQMQETYASTSAPVISDESPACPENKLPPLHRSSHHTDWRADLFPMVANSNAGESLNIAPTRSVRHVTSAR